MKYKDRTCTSKITGLYIAELASSKISVNSKHVLKKSPLTQLQEAVLFRKQNTQGTREV